MADLFPEWNIHERHYPDSGTPEERMRFLLSYAILAPSGHNTQPWLFRMRADGVELFADRTRCLPVVDPFDRALTISCGAALGHLRTAIRYFGNEPDILLLPDDHDADLLAYVTFGSATTPSPLDIARFHAITRRRTTRKHYPDEPIPEALGPELRAVAAEEGCELVIVSDAQGKRALATLVAEGDRAQFSDPSFRRELASWVHSRRAADRDGMSGAAFGMPDMLSAVGGLVIRTLDIGERQGATDEALATESPALLVIATHRDDPEHWLIAGMALSTILLAVTSAGWTSTYLNQPVETEDLRPRLREAAGLGGHPQLLLRIGRGKSIDPAIRRPVCEVIIEQNSRGIL